MSEVAEVLSSEDETDKPLVPVATPQTQCRRPVPVDVVEDLDDDEDDAERPPPQKGLVQKSVRGAEEPLQMSGSDVIMHSDFAETPSHAAPEPIDELDRQAQALAEKALEKLPEAVRTAKLPKVKEGILKRLRENAGTQVGASLFATLGPPSVLSEGSNDLCVAPQPYTDPSTPASVVAAPPPPPEEEERTLSAAELEGVESCGDDLWFNNLPFRRALRESVVSAHADQKILVGPPLEEIKRICPGNGRVLGAGAVLRLGGSRVGGYGEQDIAYAYRQLSRALHPDKNPDIVEAPNSFKRLTDAAEELRRALVDARTCLEVLCMSLGRALAPELLERPQEPLLAEATRLLAAILAFAGEGEVRHAALERGQAAFSRSSAFAKIDGQSLVKDWYGWTRLLELFASSSIRAAYDCAPKRLRASFLCLLNRTAVAEAKRQKDYLRNEWHDVMAVFPELAAWRDILDRLKKRVSGDGKDDDVTKHFPTRPRRDQKGRVVNEDGRKSRDGHKDDPVCWNFVSRGHCRSSARCRYLHHYPPGYDVESAKAALLTPRMSRLESRMDSAPDGKTKDNIVSPPEPQTSRWAQWWRAAIRAVLPSSAEAAAPSADIEVRRLAVALWRDITEELGRSAAADCLKLFRAEPSGRSDPLGLIHPCKEYAAEWAFVPASDILLTVGLGFVCVTCEGISAVGPADFLRESFSDAVERLGGSPDAVFDDPDIVEDVEARGKQEKMRRGTSITEMEGVAEDVEAIDQHRSMGHSTLQAQRGRSGASRQSRELAPPQRRCDSVGTGESCEVPPPSRGECTSGASQEIPHPRQRHAAPRSTLEYREVAPPRRRGNFMRVGGSRARRSRSRERDQSWREKQPLPEAEELWALQRALEKATEKQALQKEQSVEFLEEPAEKRRKEGSISASGSAWERLKQMQPQRES